MNEVRKNKVSKKCSLPTIKIAYKLSRRRCLVLVSRAPAHNNGRYFLHLNTFNLKTM